MANNIIRQQNIELLTQKLFKKGSAFKSELSKDTDISIVTINSLIKQLVAENIVIEGELTQSAIGRPAARYYFNYEMELFLLISIQEEKIGNQKDLVMVASIVNLKQEIKFSKKFRLEVIDINFIVEKVKECLETQYAVVKIGISIPGKIYKSVVVSSLGKKFNGWNLEKAITNITDIPIRIDNDTNLLTMGYMILNKMNMHDTTVGIFYPENSMPGITIYTNGSIVLGNNNLAGEAKFLPHLIDEKLPQDNIELVEKLVKIVEIYNAVVAPRAFIIAAESVKDTTVLDVIKKSFVIKKQANKSQINFIDDFDKSLSTGLFWLVNKDKEYRI